MLEPLFLPFELLATVGLLILSRVRIPGMRAICGPPWNLLRSLGARPAVAICVSAIVSLVFSVGISTVRRPCPIIHDEFSYLLAADTFAHGRLTNPVHPLWEHFETFHVIQSPTYASKYPPGQGLLLAAGIVLGRDPLLGVWLGTALATAALCWMLQGWVPGRWALFGALLAAFHSALQFEWGQSYWGGSVALIGGALLFGAYPRLVERARPWDAIVLALGAALLAVSRPFEGLVVTLPVGIALAAWLVRDRQWTIFSKFGRVVVPAAFVLTCAGTALAYYHFRVTGDPLKMPAQLHEQTYSPYPLFLWQPLSAAPAYLHPAMERFHLGWSLAWYQQQQTLAGIVQTKGPLLFSMWWFFLRVSLTLPLLAIPWIIRRPSVRLALAAILLLLCASTLSVWIQPHYLAPAFPALWLLVVEGCRVLRASRLIGDGRLLVCGIAGLTLIACGVKFARFAAVTPVNFATKRQDYMARLERDYPGKRHLILVRYGDDSTGLDEYVYNAADIDGSKIVWAREMDSARNQRLVDYFADRRAWLLRVDVTPHKMRPYPLTGSSNVPSRPPTEKRPQAQVSP